MSGAHRMPVPAIADDVWFFLILLAFKIIPRLNLKALPCTPPACLPDEKYWYILSEPNRIQIITMGGD
jgi:hypothetical protein